jgi:hypothetical protein
VTGLVQPAQGVPAVVRPTGPTDQAAKGLVAAAFAACAAATTISVNDCHQVSTHDPAVVLEAGIEVATGHIGRAGHLPER